MRLHVGAVNVGGKRDIGESLHLGDEVPELRRRTSLLHRTRAESRSGRHSEKTSFNAAANCGPHPHATGWSRKVANGKNHPPAQVVPRGGKSHSIGRGRNRLRGLSLIEPILIEEEGIMNHSTVQRLVVPLDGSPPAERALPFATRIAQAARAELILLNVVPGPRTAFLAGAALEAELLAHEHAEAEAKASLERVAAQLPDSHGIQVHVRVRTGEPAPSIAAELTAESPDLIVMSTHGRTGGMRFLYGSVAEDLLRATPLPIVLVPPWSVASWPGGETLRFLVALDGSEFAEQVLPSAMKIGRALSAELYLVRVVDPAECIHPEAAKDQAASYLQRVARGSQYDSGAITSQVLWGPPGDQIAAAARDAGIHMIAMATHGRGAAARLAMGSVASSVIRLARVPILLVRPSTREGHGREHF